MNTPAKIRILLVDDHFIVRMGLAGSIEHESDMQVIAEASDGTEAVELFEKHRPDVAILDGRLPDFHGVEAVSRILKMHPDAKLMLLSIDETEGDVAKALAAGVKSYLPKSVPRAELITAIRALHRGETYFPKEIAALAKKYRDRPPLSEREMQILKLVAQGQANKQIADELGIAEITVKVRVSHILEKLGAPDRTRATTKAIELGILKI